MFRLAGSKELPAYAGMTVKGLSACAGMTVKEVPAFAGMTVDIRE
jgi:hypothetical protein